MAKPPAPRDHSDRALRALDTPLLGFIGARPLDPTSPPSGIALEVTPDAENAVGALHGGVISTLLDVVAYMALVPELEAGEEAITHALYISYQRGARSGDRVVGRGQLARRSRHLAFVTSELSADQHLLAAAHVTKSIVRPS